MKTLCLEQDNEKEKQMWVERLYNANVWFDYTGWLNRSVPFGLSSGWFILQILRGSLTKMISTSNQFFFPFFFLFLIFLWGSLSLTSNSSTLSLLLPFPSHAPAICFTSVSSIRNDKRKLLPFLIHLRVVSSYHDRPFRDICPNFIT